MPQRIYDVAALDDLGAVGMQQIEVEGTKILLIRDSDTVSAIGATCPHAGGPLTEGVLHGSRVICPWHKAAFCARTGAVLAPPAIDPVPRFDVRVEGSRVMVALPEIAPSRATPPHDERCFVIAGAGAAGAVAAQTLREAGFGGRIVMLDRENRVPYDRTVLSKYALSGEPGAEKTPLQVQSFYKSHKIERRTAEIVRLDAASRRIECADGKVLHYDAALLATGCTPRRPDIPGMHLKNVFALRSRADADAILAQAERSERTVILGASFVGMEVAASRAGDLTSRRHRPSPFLAARACEP